VLPERPSPATARSLSDLITPPRRPSIYAYSRFKARHQYTLVGRVGNSATRVTADDPRQISANSWRRLDRSLAEDGKGHGRGPYVKAPPRLCALNNTCFKVQNVAAASRGVHLLERRDLHLWQPRVGRQEGDASRVLGWGFALQATVINFDCTPRQWNLASLTQANALNFKQISRGAPLDGRCA
jgi:hypothetical protein